MVERRRAASRVPCLRIGSDGRVHRDAALHCPSAAELPIHCRGVRMRLDRQGVTNPAAHAGLLVPKHSSMTPAAAAMCLGEAVVEVAAACLATGEWKTLNLRSILKD